jgi:hypothetical protein
VYEVSELEKKVYPIVLVVIGVLVATVVLPNVIADEKAKEARGEIDADYVVEQASYSNGEVAVITLRPQTRDGETLVIPTTEIWFGREVALRCVIGDTVHIQVGHTTNYDWVITRPQSPTTLAPSAKLSALRERCPMYDLNVNARRAIVIIVLLLLVYLFLYIPVKSVGPETTTRVVEVLGVNNEGYQNMYTYWVVRLEDRPGVVKAYYEGDSLDTGDTVRVRARCFGGVNIVGVERSHQ